MAIGTMQGGGHIDTPQPEQPVKQDGPRRINTPEPAHDTPAPSPPAPEPRIWQLRQRANPYFMGREKLIQTVHDQIREHPICHIFGPTGSGTSQTALSYAFRARSDYDAVFWVDGKDALLLRFDLARIADEMGLADEADLGHLERVDAFRNWLEARERWLLIIDGVTNYAMVRGALPARIRGKVLITGDRALDDGDVTVLEHPPLPDETARRFLEHRAQQLNAEGLDAIVAACAGLTLPLFLAGAHCHTARIPVKDYGEALGRNTAEREAPGATAMEATCYATAQALNYASAENPAALELMALCAFFDPEDIPLVTLYDGAPFLPRRLSACVTDPGALNQCLTLLFRLGLLQFEQNSITIHPAIQSATQRLLGQEQANAWLMTALRVVLEAFPIESEYRHPIPACSILVRHAMAVTRLSEQAGNLREGTGNLLNHVGLYLHACGELETAQRCFERSIALAEALHGSPAHPTVAARINSLGVVFQDQKRFEDAGDCYRRAIELCETIYGPARDAAMGPAHRSMLTMPRRNLCRALELMEDYDGARAAYDDALETFVEVYCWNHPVVAECMNGLGEMLYHRGSLVSARQCFLKAVQSEENAEKPEPGALSHYIRNLAHCLVENGQYEEARKFYGHALDADRADFGPAHESVAADLQGLARIHRARSRFAEAHACLDEALAIRNALQHGPTEKKALLWRMKGRCELDANNFNEAASCFREALKLVHGAAGPASVAAGPDYIYLGRALERLEQHGEAEAAFLKALRLHEKENWLDGDDLNGLYGRLVRLYRAQENFARAAEYQERVLQDHQSRFGDSHDRVGADAYGLGNLHIALGDMKSAARYLRLAVDIYTASRGADNERTVRVRQKYEMVAGLNGRNASIPPAPDSSDS